MLPIQNDPRSSNGTSLGRQPDWIFNHAIGGGQANFDQWIEDLSPRNRVMLYALFNQKAHVDELIHAFNKFLPDPNSFKGATVIDIGCGPFTAGLALANVIGNAVKFRYFGIDRSSEMCLFANELSNEVRILGELHGSTEVSFQQSVDAIDFGQRRGAEITVFVLSYLLASETIDVDALVAEIDRTALRIGMGQTFVLYTNSAREEARTNYPSFKDRMIAIGFRVHVDETETFEDSDKPREIHYALFERPAISTLSIAEFPI